LIVGTKYCHTVFTARQLMQLHFLAIRQVAALVIMVSSLKVVHKVFCLLWLINITKVDHVTVFA
jgi:hypothetical protein